MSKGGALVSVSLLQFVGVFHESPDLHGSRWPAVALGPLWGRNLKGVEGEEEWLSGV